MRGHLPLELKRLMALMPLLPLEIISRHLMINTVTAWPTLLARLEDYADRIFVIDPIDCPFVFVITLHRSGVSLRVQRGLGRTPCAARIAAPLFMLLGMLDGTYDGDALFFSRDLTIEGDTEAVLALRNALENAEVDACTVLGLPERLKDPINRAVGRVLGLIRELLDPPRPDVPHRSVPII